MPVISNGATVRSAMDAKHFTYADVAHFLRGRNGRRLSAGYLRNAIRGRAPLTAQNAERTGEVLGVSVEFDQEVEQTEPEPPADDDDRALFVCGRLEDSLIDLIRLNAEDAA